MNVYVSIDGVLRNTLQKFDYHYKDYFLNTETESEETFEYGVSDNIHSENLMDSYRFQSEEEFLKFLYFDFPMEIFGHGGLSYNQAATELNTLIFSNPNIKFTLVGLSEKGKAKPSTLFFLSRNGFICDNVKFATYDEINDLWGDCDLWITDDRRIANSCPFYKKVIKFNTFYNNHFTNQLEINKLSEIKQEWLKFSENIILSISKVLLNKVRRGLKL